MRGSQEASRLDLQVRTGPVHLKGGDLGRSACVYRGVPGFEATQRVVSQPYGPRDRPVLAVQHY